MNLSTETIILGGGCFWGVEAALKSLNGVLNTEVGYCGGESKNPSYEDVCSKNTGHAEVVWVEFNSSVISLKKLINFFLKIHNPTLLNQQGNDIGSQYRSAIFCNSEEQKNEISKYIQDFKDSEHLTKQIVTELTINTQFWPAEAYHQDYLDKNPNGYCHINLNSLPKI